MSNFLPAALEYHAAGLRVIPFTRNAQGRIIFPKWEKYRESQSEADIRQLFSSNSDGIAMLTGVQGIEAVDIDVKHDPEKKIGKKYMEWVNLQMSGSEALKNCVVQKTKSDGWHLIYRTHIHEGSQKLAYLEGGTEAVIETRGQGGLLFVAPTPGYEVKRGSLKDIRMIEDKGRACFMRSAAEFSRRDEVLQNDETPKIVGQPKKPDFSANAGHLDGGLTPGDDYNERNDIVDVATRYGWTVLSRSGGMVRLTRPGSKSGDVHATIVTTKAGQKRFYPFTTSTQYDAQKCYSAFSMYAVEEHRGDLSAAAKALYQQGYGSRGAMPPAATQTASQKNADSAPTDAGLFDRIKATKFDFHAPIPNPDALLTITQNGKIKKVGGLGQVGVFSGQEKSGKSFLLTAIAASAFGRQALGFNLDLRGKKMIWVDTEMGDEFFALNHRRMHTMAGLSTNAPNYEAYHLRGLAHDEQVAALEMLIDAEPNLAVLVIDGFADLLLDFNDQVESKKLVAKLLKWSKDRNILVMGVLHQNKNNGYLTGHLGTELRKKIDFCISVSREENCYTVTNPYCRYGEFGSFEFQRDELGMLPAAFLSDTGQPSFSPMPMSMPSPRLEPVDLVDFYDTSGNDDEECPF